MPLRKLWTFPSCFTFIASKLRLSLMQLSIQLLRLHTVLLTITSYMSLSQTKNVNTFNELQIATYGFFSPELFTQ